MSERQFAFTCTQRDIDPSPEQAQADRDAYAQYERAMEDYWFFHPEQRLTDTIDLPDQAYFHPETWDAWVRP